MTPIQHSSQKCKCKYPLEVEHTDLGPILRLGGRALFGALPRSAGKPTTMIPYYVDKVTCGVLEDYKIRDPVESSVFGALYNWKGFFKEATELVGPVIHKRVRALQWQQEYFVWDESLRKYFWTPSGAKRSTLQLRIKNAFKYRHILEELHRDNLLYLAPITAFLGVTPQEAKGHFGKGLWKKLCSQSPHRINLLGHVCGRSSTFSLSQEDTREVLRHAVELRSGILAGMDYLSEDRLLAGKLAPKVKDFARTYAIVSDTKYMSRQADKVFDPNWSLRRIQEEHDRLTEERNARQLAEKLARDASLKESFAEPFQHEYDGFTFKKLTTKWDIESEGQTMSHCVGSYSARAYNRKYDVFTVEGNDERATLGVSLDDNGYATFNQCYRKYNQRISPRLEKACTKLLEEYNKDKTRAVNSRNFPIY